MPFVAFPMLRLAHRIAIPYRVTTTAYIVSVTDLLARGTWLRNGCFHCAFGPLSQVFRRLIGADQTRQVGQAGQHHIYPRVRATTRLGVVDGQRLRVQVFGNDQFTRVPIAPCQVAQRVGHIEMMSSQQILLNDQRALKHGFGPTGVTQCVVCRGQVACVDK